MVVMMVSVRSSVFSRVDDGVEDRLDGGVSGDGWTRHASGVLAVEGAVVDPGLDDFGGEVWPPDGCC